MQRGQQDGDTGPRYESFVLGLEEEFEKSERSEEECQVDRLSRAGCELDKMWGHSRGRRVAGRPLF